ncbi:transposable element Tcb1 transposase [Trichonephila clavipes]|nr:transposable element Tcb1 transposase [Trichonephila clavipes]
MTVTDRSVTLRTVAQHIDSVRHHSVSARTIPRRLPQCGLSARRPLHGLTLTQNNRRLHRQRCDERRIWRNNRMKFSLLASHASVCNTTMVGLESGGTVSCVKHHHTGREQGIMVRGCIGWPSSTPLVHIAGTSNNQRCIFEVLEPVVIPYLQGLATAIFKHDNARPYVCTHYSNIFRQPPD